MSEYKNILTEFIGQELLHGRAVPLTEETDLLNAGVIDSLGILRMVAFIEERVGIPVPDEDVVFENFQSIRALADYISRRKDANSPLSA
jgi:acyl carrier protein